MTTEPRHSRFLQASSTAHHRGRYAPEHRTYRQLQGLTPNPISPGCPILLTRRARANNNSQPADDGGIGTVNWSGTPLLDAIVSVTTLTPPQTWATKPIRIEAFPLTSLYPLYRPVSLKVAFLSPEHLNIPYATTPVQFGFPIGQFEAHLFTTFGGTFPDFEIRVTHVRLVSDGVQLTGPIAVTAPWIDLLDSPPTGLAVSISGITVPFDETLSCDFWLEIRLNTAVTIDGDLGVKINFANDGATPGDPFTSYAHYPPHYTVNWFTSGTNFDAAKHTYELDFVGHGTGFTPPDDPWKVESDVTWTVVKSACSVVATNPTFTDEYSLKFNNEVAELAITRTSNPIAYYRPTGTDHGTPGPMGRFNPAGTTTFLPYALSSGGSHPRNYNTTPHAGYPTSIIVTRVNV